MILKPLATCLFATGLAVSAFRGCDTLSAKTFQNIKPTKALGSPLLFTESPYWLSVSQDGALPEQDRVQVFTKGKVNLHKLDNGKHALNTHAFQILISNTPYGILSGEKVDDADYTVFLDPKEVDALQETMYQNGVVLNRATDGVFEEINFNVPEGFYLMSFTCLNKNNTLETVFQLVPDFDKPQTD